MPRPVRRALSLLRRLTPTAPPDVDVDDDRVAALAADATSDTVTPGVLANRDNRSNRPIVAYLDGDEQPRYVFRGTELIVADPDGSSTRKHPTRELQVVLTDRRLLFVVGGRLADDLVELPLPAVRSAYVEDEGRRLYLVVDADREDTPMTFFADVTLEGNGQALVTAAEAVDPADGSTGDCTDDPTV